MQPAQRTRPPSPPPRSSPPGWPSHSHHSLRTPPPPRGEDGVSGLRRADPDPPLLSEPQSPGRPPPRSPPGSRTSPQEPVGGGGEAPQGRAGQPGGVYSGSSLNAPLRRLDRLRGSWCEVLRSAVDATSPQDPRVTQQSPGWGRRGGQGRARGGQWLSGYKVVYTSFHLLGGFYPLRIAFPLHVALTSAPSCRSPDSHPAPSSDFLFHFPRQRTLPWTRAIRHSLQPQGRQCSRRLREQVRAQPSCQPTQEAGHQTLGRGIRHRKGDGTGDFRPQHPPLQTAVMTEQNTSKS